MIDLKKEEVPNCMLYLEKRQASILSTSSTKQSLKLVLVGTCFMDVDETFPSKGRLLVIEIDTQKRRMNLRHVENITSGSVQAITTLKEDHKYLVLGVNNHIQLY